MTTRLCIAPHRDNPPTAAGGGLLLCFGHLAALTEALTGPSAADDPTMDVAWGVRTWWGVAGYSARADALGALESNRRRYAADQRLAREERKWRRPPVLLVYTGSDWIGPKDYRPGALARAWTALEGLTSHRTAAGAYVSGTAEAALPINPAVAALRDRIPGVLASWARIHVEELPATPPQAADAATVGSWLARYTDWAAAQLWAGEYVAELSELIGRARRLIDLPQTPRESVGPCPERHDGQQCAGQLWTQPREPGAPGLPQIRCDTCHTTFDSSRWEALRDRLKRVA